MNLTEITLDGETLGASALWSFAKQALNPNAQFKIYVTKAALAKVAAASRYVEKIMSSEKLIYSINTGFGDFRNVRIKDSELRELQRNILLSHSCGVGPAFGRDIVMAMWILRLNTLCRGNSGIRPETFQRIIHMLEAGIIGVVPSRGSVGASGDLAPSAHASLALIGEGECSVPVDGVFKSMAARDALQLKKLEPALLGPKEGLCLINGTQTTTALAIKAWHEGSLALKSANLALAMSIEGFRASHDILHRGVIDGRNHPGVKNCATEVTQWLQPLFASEISKSHENCGEVQDPYSFRCGPQVHGAVADELKRAEEILNREINSSSDNPLLFPESNEAISGGNFHAIFTARVSDNLASALSTLASISERRMAQFMDSKASRLPTFLINNGGLNSGLMMVHVTAAALVSECKSLSFPASVDSIPTNNDREDHVSMGPIAGVKACQVAEHCKMVLAIELLAASQAIDLLRPLKTSNALEGAHKKIRSRVSFIDKDRSFTPDIEAIKELIDQQELFV